MKKNLRSLLCGLLALVLVCSCAGAAFAKDNGATPVISVHGMGGSGLYLNPGTEDAQQVGVFDAKSPKCAGCRRRQANGPKRRH